MQVVLALAYVLVERACLAQRSPATFPNIQVSRPGWVRATAVQSDGKIIVGGYFFEINGVPRNNIARLNPDGTVDTTWSPHANGAVSAIVSNGPDIFVAGQFTEIGGFSRTGLAKLASAGVGEVDAMWNPNLSGFIDAITIESTNLYVATSSLFTDYATVAKLSTSGNGQADPNWNPVQFIGTFIKPVWSLAANADSVFVAGSFYRVIHGTNVIERSALIKLNANGTGEPDLAWNPPYNRGIAQALVLDENKLYLAGTFYQPATQTYLSLARVAATGAGEADASWQPDLVDGWVDHIALGGTNLYASGRVTTASGLTDAPLVRLSTADGAVDPTWNPYPQNSRYPEPFPNLAGLVANGTDLFVIGDFDSIGGQTRHGLALLAGADAPRLVEGPYSIVFVRRNPLDAAEVSHYRITDIKGGNLCLAGSLARVRVGDFITVEDGANGLHFIRDGSSGSISAVSALNETPDGAGNAETTLVVQGEPASCILHFGLNDGLTLAGLQGRSYRIEYTEALGDGANWLPLTTATSAGVPQVVPGTRSTAQRQCYYRAVLIP